MKHFAIAAVIALTLSIALPATAQEATSPEKVDYVHVEGDLGKSGKIVRISKFVYDGDKVGHLLTTICGDKEKFFLSTPVISSNRDCDGVRIDADAIVKKLNG